MYPALLILSAIVLILLMRLLWKAEKEFYETTGKKEKGLTGVIFRMNHRASKHFIFLFSAIALMIILINLVTQF